MAATMFDRQVGVGVSLGPPFQWYTGVISMDRAAGVATGKPFGKSFATSKTTGRYLEDRQRQLQRAGSATILGNTSLGGTARCGSAASFEDLLAPLPRSTYVQSYPSQSWLQSRPESMQSASSSSKVSTFQGEISAPLLLDGVRLRLRRRGFQSTKDLERLFEKLDTQGGDRVLDLDEFTEGMLGMRLLNSPEECRAVFEQIDTDNSGTLELEEFLEIARGVLPNHRLPVVEEAFAALLRPEDRGVVSLRILQDSFCTERHPDYITGQRTEAELWDHFSKEFTTVATRGRVTLDDFIKFYEGISAIIESDAYFEAVVRKSWNLSGGAGSTAHVRVFDSKGQSSQVTIRGIGVDRYHPFFETMLRQRLAEQGFVDVPRLEVQ